MDHPALKAFEQQQLKTNLPHFEPGDTVRVNTRVIEGDKERIQAFEGVVISISGGGISETFIVRKISFGVGVERGFLMHSPRIESITVIRRGHVRRAKLYYLRDRMGKGTRIKARQRTLNTELAAKGVESKASKVKKARKGKKGKRDAARAAAAAQTAPAAVAETTASEPAAESAPSEE